MKELKTAIRALYSVYALLLFVLCLAILFPWVLLASCWGRIRGGNMIYRLCTGWADVWLWLIGIRTRIIYETGHDRKRQFIFVANHISYMDVPMLVKSIRQPVRALGKSEMGKIPVFGFLYRYAVVMVDRGSARDRARSVGILKSVVFKGISIFIFPEGTFNTSGELLKDFYDGAFRVAIETQTPIKPVIFPDTLNRLHFQNIFSLDPGISRAVYLEEIPVAGLELKDVRDLKKIVFEKMAAALARYGRQPLVHTPV